MTRQIISHYHVLEKLGGGVWGSLKFLPEELVNDQDSLTRFRREAWAASALDHPNICTIYEISEKDGLTFIAMEFIEGKTLADSIAAKALEAERLLDLAVEIAVNITRLYEAVYMLQGCA